MRTKWFVLLALVCLALPGFAQTLGDISGEVRDASGAVVAGVTVTLTNTATNAVRTATSNESGVYAFPALTPGIYNIKAEKQGFKTVSTSGLEVQVQQNVRFDVTMTVGAVSESIEVSASAISLATENATVGTVVEQKRIVELPLNGRNYLALTALAPNVSFGFPSAGQADGRQGGDRANQNISVAGMRNNFNRFTLDGVENTDPNFNTYVIFPSAEALQEFKVQTGIYPAEFGRGATQINVSTKGGGNEFHGALYEFLRNATLDARNFGNRGVKDPFKWNQFGFTLSGPVWIPKVFNGKNRLFFMSNYEWFRQRRQVRGRYNLPSSAMRGGNFSEVSAGVFDPATRAPITQNGVTFTQAQPFPNNTIPSSRFNPVSTRLLEFYPAPNLASTVPGTNHEIPLGRPVNKDQFIQRFDFVESSKSNWFGRYSRSDENQINENLFLNGEAIITKATQWMFTNTRVITNALVNEFRFGYTKFYNTTGPELAFSRDVVGALGIPGLASGPPVQWGIPSVSMDGFSGFGNSSEGPYENNNSAIQFINNVSWVRGKHNIKIGGEVRRDAYNQIGNQFARGQFSFITTATNSFRLNANNQAQAFGGLSFADYLIGQINQSEAAVSIANGRFRATGFAFYIDDSWRISPKFTLSLGLRYENTPPWEDQTGTLFNGIVPNDIRPTDFRNAPVTDLSLHPFFMRQGAARQNCYEGINLRWVANPTAPQFGPPQVRCDGSLGNRLVGRDNNDWAPRIGASYQLNSKTVLRVGAGMFYSQDTGNPRFDMSRNLAGRLRSNTNTIAPNLTWQNSLASIAGGTANVLTPYTFANPFDRRTPRSVQYVFNIQRELPGGMVTEIGYVGSFSRRLEGLRAINESLPAPRALGIPERLRAPFPEFGRIQLVDNGNNANYNSLGAKLTKRYSNGITYLISYTYAKSIDTNSAIRNQGGDTLFPQNSYCRQCERARSSFDTRHRYVTSAQWELPFGKGKRFNIENPVANVIAGGWEIGSIVTLQSGFPLTVTQSGDPSNTGGQFDRPIATGQRASLDRGQQDPQRFFNLQAFSRTPDGSFGNVGRNTLDSPGIIGWDFIAMKNFTMPWKESHRLQFRFEAFNFPNHPNWGNPDTNLNSGTLDPATGLGRNFGTISGTRTNMRQLQMALRYTF